MVAFLCCVKQVDAPPGRLYRVVLVFAGLDYAISIVLWMMDGAGDTARRVATFLERLFFSIYQTFLRPLPYPMGLYGQCLAAVLCDLVEQLFD